MTGTWDPDTLKVLEDEKIAGLERLFTSELRRIEAVISGQQRAVELLGTASQQAQDKFEASVTARFTTVNEFRQALADLGADMATRRELEAAMKAMDDHFEENRRGIVNLTSRIDVGPAQLSALQTRADTQAGRQMGVGLSANAAVIALGLLLTIIGTIAAIYIATHK